MTADIAFGDVGEEQGWCQGEHGRNQQWSWSQVRCQGAMHVREDACSYLNLGGLSSTDHTLKMWFP